MRLIYIILLLVFSYSLNVFSQDTIVLLTGEKILLKEYTFTDTDFYLSYTNKKGKHKTIERDYIYSINDTLGNVKCLYKEDTLASEDNEVQLTCDQMFFYVKGQSAAVEHYKAPLVTVGGFLTGAAGAYFPLIGWGQPIFPTVYCGAIGFTNSSKSIVKKKFPSYSDNEYFIYGFQEGSRAKRTKNAIAGGITGLFAGVISIMIIGALQ